jgi:hypothetical protein
VCPPAVVPTVTSFSSLWDLDTGEFRGTPSCPSLLYPSERSLSLVGSGAEESTPAVTALAVRPATNQAYTAPLLAQLSCRPLDADFSPVEAVALSTRPWAELPFACVGRGTDSAPKMTRVPGAYLQVP